MRERSHIGVPSLQALTLPSPPSFAFGEIAAILACPHLRTVTFFPFPLLPIFVENAAILACPPLRLSSLLHRLPYPFARTQPYWCALTLGLHPFFHCLSSPVVRTQPYWCALTSGFPCHLLCFPLGERSHIGVPSLKGLLPPMPPISFLSCSLP